MTKIQIKCIILRDSALTVYTVRTIARKRVLRRFIAGFKTLKLLYFKWRILTIVTCYRGKMHHFTQQHI